MERVQSPKSKVQSQEESLRSPGLLRKHYSPRARLQVSKWKSDVELRSLLTHDTSHLSPHTHVISHTHIPSGDGLAGVSVIPHDAEAFARAIYAELHRCDEAGAELIVVEALPDSIEWRAIADRLNRAAAD